MNPIERKREIYNAKIRGIACRILVENLHTEIADDDADRNAKANALFEEYSEVDIKEALAFATYADDVADAKCPKCEGIGAVPINHCMCKGKMVEGVFQHVDCVDGLASVAYEVCDCVIAGDVKRKAALRAVEPAFRVKGKREDSLGQRVKEAEERLRKLEVRRDIAVASVIEEIRQLEVNVTNYRNGRDEIERDIATRDAAIFETRGRIEHLRERLSAAEADLSRSLAAREVRSADLVKFDADNAGLTKFAADLEAKRERIAGHHAPKIEKVKRTLSRLMYLRGETKIAVKAEDVQVVVK